LLQQKLFLHIAFLHSIIYISSIIQQKYRQIRPKSVDIALLIKFQHRIEM